MTGAGGHYTVVASVSVQSHVMGRILSLCLAGACAAIFGGVAPVRAADRVWWEGEEPVAMSEGVVIADVGMAGKMSYP